MEYGLCDYPMIPVIKCRADIHACEAVLWHTFDCNIGIVYSNIPE